MYLFSPILMSVCFWSAPSPLLFFGYDLTNSQRKSNQGRMKAIEAMMDRKEFLLATNNFTERRVFFFFGAPPACVLLLPA